MQTDRQQIERLYGDMYRAMMAKDRPALERIHDDRFTLTHMTGMRQSKAAYIESIMNGTLNYFSEQTERLDVSIDGDSAVMVGQSRVCAAVFGGGRHTWPLRLRFTLARTADGWKLTGAQASTY